MQTNRHDLLKARLAIVRRDLDPILGLLDQEMMDWAPADGMRTIGGQLVEIVATEIQLVARLKDGRSLSDEEVARTILGDCSSLENLKNALAEHRRRTLDYLDSLIDTDLADEVPFDGGWFASLMLPTVPRAEVFLNIADHEWYHVGQLTSYLWARGKNPYTW